MSGKLRLDGDMSVAMKTGAPILGVIDQPYIGERFCGGLGRAEVVHREAIMGAVRGWRCVSVAICAMPCCFPRFQRLGRRRNGGLWASCGQCQLVRYGLDCYAYALLAAGQIDLVIEAGLNAYDICAPIALVQASGGLSPIGKAASILAGT